MVYPVYKYITPRQYLEYHGRDLRLVLSIRISMKIIRNQARRNHFSNDGNLGKHNQQRKLHILPGRVLKRVGY